MRKVFTFLLLLTAGFVNAQTVSTDALRLKFPSLFTAFQYNDFVVLFVAPQTEPDLFADLTNNNTLYLDYILEHYSSFDKLYISNIKNDSARLINTFRQAIVQDTMLNRYLKEMSYWYLQPKGIQITGYQAPARANITIAQLTHMAVKFFYAAGIAPDKSINWKVCVGENAYAVENIKSGFPLVEAFCFMTVFNNYPLLRQQFTDYGALLSEKTKRLPEADRLTIARDSMYAKMAASEDLRKILVDSYNNKKDILGFRLIE